jgi:hypothetical protein
MVRPLIAPMAEAAAEDWPEEELFQLFHRAYPYRNLERAEFDEVVQMLAQGFATRRGRRAALIHHDAVNGRIRGRRGARLLAITSGGAIPDNADYRVILEPENTFIGTVNEDFAVESLQGDIFQLGNMSWRILRVQQGVVRAYQAAHRDFDASRLRVAPSVGETDVSDKPAWLRAYVAETGLRTYPVRLETHRVEALLSVNDTVRVLMATLEDLHETRNTIVVFTSDNGFCWDEHRVIGKGCPYEECLRVPLVIKYPGMGAPRRIAYGPTPEETLDLYPTAATHAPMAIFLHGGGWRAGTADHWGFAAEMFVDAGVHYIAPDFVNVAATGGDLRPMVDQVRRATPRAFR